MQQMIFNEKTESKEVYENPVMEVQMYDNEDIIITSDEDVDQNGWT